MPAAAAAAAAVEPKKGGAPPKTKGDPASQKKEVPTQSSKKKDIEVESTAAGSIFGDKQVDYEEILEKAGLSVDWRTAAPYNFSDFRIIVNEEVIYHVHRNVVACGPHSSTLLREITILPISEHVSRGNFKFAYFHGKSMYSIQSLPQQAFGLFEQVLDYFYTGKIIRDPDTCLPLLYIGILLRCEHLIKVLHGYFVELMESPDCIELLLDLLEFEPFLDKNMTPANAHLFRQYLKQAYRAVVNYFNTMSHQNLVRIGSLPTHAFRTIMSHPDLRKGKPDPRRVCHCVTGLYRDRGRSLTKELFFEFIPMITVVPEEDALMLLQLCLRFNEEVLKVKVLEVVARHFDDLNMDDAATMSIDTIKALLQMDTLNVKTEDSVFTFLSVYARSQVDANGKSTLSQAQLEDLWGCCRFSFLSLSNLRASHADLPLPKDYIVEGLILRSLRIDRAHQDEYLEYLASYSPDSPAALRARPRESYTNIEEIAYAFAHVPSEGRHSTGTFTRVKPSDEKKKKSRMSSNFPAPSPPMASVSEPRTKSGDGVLGSATVSAMQPSRFASARTANPAESASGVGDPASASVASSADKEKDVRGRGGAPVGAGVGGGSRGSISAGSLNGVKMGSGDPFPTPQQQAGSGPDGGFNFGPSSQQPQPPQQHSFSFGSQPAPSDGRDGPSTRAFRSGGGPGF
eukprot:Rmarinus@m.13228